MGNRVENGWIVVGGAKTTGSISGMHWIKASAVMAFYTPDNRPELTGVQLVGGDYYNLLDVTADEFARLLRDSETPDWIRADVKQRQENIRAEQARVNANGR